MLKLSNITKDYITGDSKVNALRGVSLSFRKSEFVAILGASGCGKTTLLNIVGGLDKYTTGDLVINGISTKNYKDSDWDTYRNHSVGFVFQSYNLIPHQTVLKNVELALTISGVSKQERKQRAIDALEKVGLGDQINKKPNQLSGGQMQRVSIARALVNDPEIVLADEPTGALDSKTSVQVMEILKEISKDRLVVMVTHNPELADTYSTRIIRLTDGLVVSDSNPYEAQSEIKTGKQIKKVDKKIKKNASMSFWTAFCLSLNNLLTKKARTIMVAFAGSIGIIGIALILSLSSGFQSYIDKVQEDTLSTYPIMIEKQNMDMSSLLESMMGSGNEEEHELDKVYSNDIMVDLFSSVMSQVYTNDLQNFKHTIENDPEFQQNMNAISYTYNMNVNIYSADTSDSILKVNPSTIFQETLGAGLAQQIPMMGTAIHVWSEMLDNQELLESQYDIVYGKWPQNYNEVVLVVDKNNEVTDYALYALGLKDSSELKGILDKVNKGEEVVIQPSNFTYEDICSVKFKLVLNPNLYEQQGNKWVDISSDEVKMKDVINAGEEISVVGIIRPNEDAAATSISGTIAYTKDLTEHIIKKTNETELVKRQVNNPKIDVFTGIPFVEDEIDMDYVNTLLETLPPEQKAQFEMMMSGLDEDEIIQMVKVMVGSKLATYENNMSKLEACNLDNPSSISLYPKDFAGKDYIEQYIDNYNSQFTGEEENKQIMYTDYIGIMLSSVSTIIDAVTYVLIAFVAISLVVSSIMIGIITYISVLERTKEIGVLRSLGARKKDISSIFNAETLIIGFTSGMLGVLVTIVLCLPINLIIDALAGIGHIAKLPTIGAITLVAISMLLSLIAGLIPSRLAAKRDPVIALRTE